METPERGKRQKEVESMYSTTKRISKKTRKAVYERDEYACILCRNQQTIHLHHVIPKGRGGSDEESNLVCLCPYCHAIVHGEAVKDYDFPFDAETAQDAIDYYLIDLYGPR